MSVCTVLEESGRVLSVYGDYAEVITERNTTCGSCAAKNSCGTGLIGEYLGSKYNRIQALNPIGAKAGDDVTLGINDEVLTRISFRFYIIPLVLLILGAFVGEQIAQAIYLDTTEPVSIIGGLLGLISGMIWLRLSSQRVDKDPDYQVVILRQRNQVQFNHKDNSCYID